MLWRKQTPAKSPDFCHSTLPAQALRSQDFIRGDHRPIHLAESGAGDSENHTLLISLCYRQWYPTPVLLPRKSHGRRSLVGCSPWGRLELDMTERLHFHFSLSCIGGGNGNPLQCSCLENRRDGRAWWAAVYGVAQSRTQLKRLSSSSSTAIHNLSGLQTGATWIPITPFLMARTGKKVQSYGSISIS